MATERLQKVLAQAGLASRRGAEALITKGRVRVNGRIVKELGTKVDPHRDRVELDGRRVVAEKPAYYVIHKPRAVVSTLRDPEGRETLAEILRRAPERVHPVGRLDYHTSGVILATNDGELTDALLRPHAAVPKVYQVKMQGHLDVPELDALRNGVVLDDGYRTRPAEVFVTREEARATWVQITLSEGKNRQIRRMGDAIGHTVLRLVRSAFADVTSEGLRPGQMRPLTGKELERLKKRFVAPYRRERAAAGG
ncbi:MAG: rRNA pseudouridine synthase [Myxococcales bacterium]|nr:rRNA pseudouridine synthase [Myxococcales bacterium]